MLWGYGTCMMSRNTPITSSKEQLNAALSVVSERNDAGQVTTINDLAYDMGLFVGGTTVADALRRAAHLLRQLRALGSIRRGYDSQSQRAYYTV